MRSAEDYGDDLDNFDRAASLVRAGLLCWTLKDYDRAIDCYTEAQAIFNADLGANQDELLWIYENLATVYSEQGKYNNASVLYLQTYCGYYATYGPNDLKTIDCLCDLRTAYERSDCSEYFDDWFYRELKLIREEAAFTRHLSPIT